MTKAIFTTAALLAASTVANAGLIISEVVDGDLTGGNPKFVEVTNTGLTDYTFAAGGIIIQANAATDLDVDVDLTGVTILAGQSYVIQSSANGGQAAFVTAYGFEADLYSSAFFSNGDDRYILTDGTNLLDIHGEINVDGTGLAWEYTDGYAYRLPDYVDGNGGVFAIGEWVHGGVASLDAPDDPARIALLQANTTPGTHNYVPEPASLALMALGGLAIVRRR